MTWLPSFLNIWSAAVAAAIVIPALLILYFLKLRRKEMAVSSTLLWKKAIQDLQVNAPFQRLRRNLLLFLQMLLLVLLLLALARPVANYTPGAGKTTVVLIDRSASMNATDINGDSRLDEAKRRAKDLVETLGRDASAAIIAFDDKAEIMHPFSSDVPSLKQAIDAIQPTDRKSSLKLAYQLAEAQASINPDQIRAVQKPDVWVFSDGRVSDAEELNITAQVHYDPIGTESAPNIAIVAMSAKRSYERPNEVQVFARLANYGPELSGADVQLSVDDQVRSIATTVLYPERWGEEERRAAEANGDLPKDSVEFTLDLEQAAVIKLAQVNTEDDTLAADNVAQVVVPPPRPLNVLLVTEGHYFLELWLRAAGLNSPQTLAPAAYEQAAPTNYDVIVFDRYQPQTLPEAGNFIFFGAVPLESPIQAEPAVYEDPLEDDAAGATVIDWARDHPMLRYLNIGSMFFVKPMRLTVPREAETLIFGSTGPLMVSYRKGPSLFVVTAFDPAWSNWAVHPTFPAFMTQTMQFMALGSDMNVRQDFEPGATPRIPRANIQRLETTPTELTVTGPGGSRTIAVPETGDVALPPLDQTGIYKLEPPVPQYESLAVNLLDENESNLVPAGAPPGGVGEVVAGGGEARLELWWWIVACAALPLLIIEWWVYTRRVHL